MSGIELVIFDMAGTTVKDTGQVAKAFTAALAEHALVATAEQLISVRGSSKREAVLSFIPEGPDRPQRADRVYASFRDQLAKRYRIDQIEQVDGAEQVFHWLRGRGIRVALNTGFDRDITDLLIASLGSDGAVVDAVVCGDDVKEGRPAPDLIFQAMKITRTNNAKHVANVGDTVLDLKAGNNAGVLWNIGVLTGAHDRQRLEQEPHTHLLSSITELCNLWENA